MIVAAEQPHHPDRTHREFLDPPWTTIEAEIRALDGQTRNNLWIIQIDEDLYRWCEETGGDCTCDDTSTLVVSSGDDGRHAVAAELISPKRMTGHRLEGPHQPPDAVDLDTALHVARHFVATGTLDPTQPWLTW